MIRLTLLLLLARGCLDTFALLHQLAYALTWVAARVMRPGQWAIRTALALRAVREALK